MSTDYASLILTLENFAKLSKTRPLSLGEVLASLDKAAFALIALILVLPFMQPIPVGPFSVLGGFTFAALGWQMWRGSAAPELPDKICQVVMSAKIWGLLVKVCLKVVGFCRLFTRPRYIFLVTGVLGQKIGGFVFMASGLLMAIPFGVLPFNNTLPGLAILFYCVGELEKDGLMVVIAFGWLIATIVYFALFFFGLYYLGGEVFNYFRYKA
ncbi:MAG: exopolysaccharide biosynthesis protein [Methylophilaceae bacterium]|nr:exopolysaccharide biosynthesis protein [Methylophilaceae bacterium]